jgi:hypothetical protein
MPVSGRERKDDSMDQERPWILLTKVVGSGEKADISGSSLLNLTAIRTVEIVSPTELKLWFSQDHIVTVRGTGATEILDYLLNRSILSNGQPFTSESPALAATEGLPLEA